MRAGSGGGRIGALLRRAPAHLAFRAEKGAVYHRTLCGKYAANNSLLRRISRTISA